MDVAYEIKCVGEDEVEAVMVLEEEAFPPDEAASAERMAMRLQEANPFFLGRYEEGSTLVGYVCGTLTAHDRLDEESMASHDPQGAVLCIHSVVVAPTRRGCGVAKDMMRAYCNYIKDQHPSVKRIQLLAKEGLGPKLYGAVGFTNLGPSGVEHGEDVWYLWDLDPKVF